LSAGFTTKTGLYGSNYLLRAAVALVGLGANTPEVTIYGELFDTLPWSASRRY
jgi:hypothetical protein